MSGEQIRRLRKKLGLTQAELAQLLGVHAVSVSRWETDANFQPPPYQMALLGEFRKAAEAEAFDRTLKNLLVSAGIVAVIFLLLQAARKS